MWTKPTATEMRFGFEVTLYVMNKQITYIEFQKHKIVTREGLRPLSFWLS